MQGISVYRRVVFLVYFGFLVSLAFGQHKHFIYLQHDQSSPFYIKHEGQILRSSSQGYLILSKLKKGRQIFFLGFNEGSQGLIKFVLDSLDSDKGFLIKNYGSSGWGLMDLQNSAILYGANDGANMQIADDRNKKDSLVNDPFGNMLAEVTKDSTVKYISSASQVKKSDTVVKIVKETPVVSREQKSVIPNATKELYSRSVIQIIDRQPMDRSMLYCFIVGQNLRIDTVSVMIELNQEDDNAVVTEVPRIDLPSEKSEVILNKEDSLVLAEVMSPSIDTTRLDTSRVEFSENLVNSDELLVDEITDSVVVVADKQTEENKTAAPKNICKKNAGEGDFIKLRKKMAGQRKEEDMLEEAVRYFRQMCFSTTQIGQLSALFISDEKKFSFFEASKLAVSDPEKFSSLGKFIDSDEYRKRFSALLPNP